VGRAEPDIILCNQINIFFQNNLGGLDIRKEEGIWAFSLPATEKAHTKGCRAEYRCPITSEEAQDRNRTTASLLNPEP